MVGDSVGNAYVYDIKPELSVPRANEASLMEENMLKLGANPHDPNM